MARSKRGAREAERQDGFINRFTGHGTSRDRRTHTRFRADIVTCLEAIEYRRSDDILRRVIEMLPREAMRRGVVLKVADKNGKQISEDLQDEFDRIDGAERVKEAGQMQRTCGGSALFPVLAGAVGDLEEPLDPYEDSIEKVDALHVLEPRELTPISWYTDVTSPKFRQPKVWRLQALSGATGRPLTPVPIHESRLVIFPGVRISKQPLPGQRPGWGDSILNSVIAVAADFGLAWGSASTLLHDFAQGVLQLGDLADILSKKNGRELLADRLAAMDMIRSSLRAILIDKNDKFTRENTPLSGFADLMIQLAQRVSAAAETPMTKLFGMSPAGLNATGDFDTRSWYDNVEGERQAYRHPIRRLFRLLALQIDGPCKGEVPDQWSIDFPPLWMPSEKEQADTRLAIAQADHIYWQDGAASSDDIAKSRWGGDSFSPEMTIDWAAREAQAKLDATAASLTPEDKTALGVDPNDPNAPADPAVDPNDPNGDAAATARTRPPKKSGDKVVKVVAHQRAVG